MSGSDGAPATVGVVTTSGNGSHGILRNALEAICSGQDLDRATARALMDHIMEGEATPAQVGAALVAFRIKGETVDEIAGMVESMRDHATPVHLDVDAVDTCGTGGDNSNTFNISTAAALVVAGAGQPVAKHGNRAASSQTGSADVLEELGVAISLSADSVRECIETVGIGFIFAPAFHPAMRHVAPVRSQLGIRTVFNILGPLANPARVRRQSVGVGDIAVASRMAAVLQLIGHEKALVFTGAGGIDELSLWGVAQCFVVTPEGVQEREIDPAAMQFSVSTVDALRGGDAATNAKLVVAVLDGATGAHRDVVLLNAAAALVAAGRTDDFPEAIALAAESIDSGAARRVLDRWVDLSRQLS